MSECCSREPPPERSQAHSGQQSSSKKGSSAKRQQDLNLSEQTVLKAEQVLKLLDSPQTFPSVTGKKVQSTLAALSARMKDSVMDIYTDTLIPGSDMTGLDLLEKMRNLQAKLTYCKDALEKWRDHPRVQSPRWQTPVI